MALRTTHICLAITGVLLLIWLGLSFHAERVPRIPGIPVTSWLRTSGSMETTSSVRRVKLKHPIPQLMDKADVLYRKKLGSQSKTLYQAVSKYKKRYKRNPPAGFDDWWAFAKSRGFKMVDEFDSMMEDLEPFWSLSPQELRRRARQVCFVFFPLWAMLRTAEGWRVIVHRSCHYLQWRGIRSSFQGPRREASWTKGASHWFSYDGRALHQIGRSS